MKKISILLVLAVLLASIVPVAFAAGNAYLSGPSAVRAGDVISVTFCAGGGILGGSGAISYDKAQLTLQSYSALVSGSWEVNFNGDRFVFFDNSMKSPLSNNTPVFKATFIVNSSLAEGAQIRVSATDVTLSDGKQDTVVGTCTFTKTVSPPLSGNGKLASLTVSNATISPAFSPDVTLYTASVPYSVSSLQVSAKAEDANAKVSVNSPALTAGGTTTVSITVTAENGTQKSYDIRVSRAQDPNYVKSANANLKELKAEGYTLSPAFSADVTQYYVWLPYEAKSVTLSGTTEDVKASLQVAEGKELEPGKATAVAVTVTAEDGTQKVYTVSAFRAPAHEDVENFLNGEPATIPETVPTTEPPTEPEPATEETQPVSDTQPQSQQPEKLQTSPITLLITGAVCAVAGAAIGAAIMWIVRKKK